MDILIDGNYEGMTIREVLTSKLGYSSNLIKKLKFSEGGITVNGGFVTVRYVLRRGDLLSLGVEDKDSDVSPYTIPCDLPIEVIFEDEWVTAVNKPHDMPAHPSLGHKLDTVANALAYRYGDRPYVFRPVNRLDRDTSGCMLTANSKAASYKMYLAMTEGRIRKRYIAVLCGVPTVREGRIETYMRRAEGSIIQREETAPDDPEGKIAITEYRVLFANDTYSVAEAYPITGRTHQLRVQFAGMGCPIVGDTLYGSESPHIGRHALHCIGTTFPHPEDGRTVNVTSSLPEDIRGLTEAVFGCVPDAFLCQKEQE
ncbi:MAG: RluA family pseudouridine synthase [Ruminococcaceae bacterium]|nr:RluA family pseudouridine synthase [Oscillospiraceae bacterium]